MTSGNAVAALQTVVIAGGPSAISLPASGPAGVEQVVAICSTDASPIYPQPASDPLALSHDLAVIASRPTGMTSMASVTFTVQP
jgi:hypothetical protein